MSSPWVAATPLAAEDFARFRTRAIFDCCKWDPQVEDVCTIADVPLILDADDWRTVCGLAERLWAEALEAEQELGDRPDLHAQLGLPRAVRRALRDVAGRASSGVARIARFDFHHTTEGWRISEVNSDVPGGLNEASGLPALMADHYPGTTPAGDTAGQYAAAFDGCAHVALVHATAYTDDRQVMAFLARRLERLGVRASLVSPSHLRWRDGRASIDTEWQAEPVAAAVRFFPGEWLPNLPPRCGWENLFSGGATRLSNPATAMLTQSKRFPLLWPRLAARLPTWTALLPDTRDPRDVDWRHEDWVLKPALGRIGEDVMIRGVSSEPDRVRIEKLTSKHPELWVAQRRFEAPPVRVSTRSLHATLGVYTIDGRAAGAYGRISDRALIDARARDAAVLVAAAAPAVQAPVVVLSAAGRAS